MITAWILNSVTGARNFSIAIILLAIIILIKKSILLYGKALFFKITICITLVLSLISVFITKFIPYYSSTYYELNKLLSGRLSLQYTLVNDYQPKLFGQYIYQSTSQTGGYYFFIDSSYAKLIFISGILFTILYYFIVIRQLFKLVDLNLYILVLVFIVILITGFVQGSAIGVSANIFIPLLCVRANLFEEDFKNNETI